MGSDSADLETYQQQREPIAERESEIVREYAGVIGANYTTDRKLYRTVTALVPDYALVVQDYEEISVENPELARIHEITITYSNLNMQGFTTLLAAIEQGDRALITEANGYLTAARTNEREYNREIDTFTD